MPWRSFRWISGTSRLTAPSFTLEETAVHIRSQVKCRGETGVEMEALTAASAAALTIYDMCKAVQRDMEITHHAGPALFIDMGQFHGVQPPIWCMFRPASLRPVERGADEGL